MAVDAFLEMKRERALADATLESYEHRLWRLLGLPGNANKPVRFVLGRGEELYRASADCAGDTHINGLIVGRMWGAWCLKQKMLRANPFECVEVIGRKTKGSTKDRLSIDESRLLEAHCFECTSDPHRVLTYGYMMLGKRASELVRIRARDLDDDGRRLRITEAKTEASVGDLPLTAELREMLIGLAQGKAPDDRLFVNESGEPMSRHVAYLRVCAVVKAVVGRPLGPQGLRRTFVDNAERQGVALRTIAEMTGHKNEGVTTRSYMSKQAAEAGAVERNFKVINGGMR